MAQPSTIAHYRITSKLGEGGMGAVYRASDTKLGREVAIKVLPDVFARDADRMARFAREAHVLASLNHPQIAAIYGVEDRAIVMELVEGETLAEPIRRGPFPLEEALPLARQIAEALGAAHEKGVIHRDLKPANVKITPDGDVKVLDFGLAKVSEAVALAGCGPDASPTLTQVTGAGVVMGTAAYMPPEQARGVVVDKRADIWAFGCVLYEMLSGKRPFEGESITDVLAAVVRSEPDWSALPSTTPAPVRRLLKRCLEKDRHRRLPDIGVARLEIDDALAAPEQPALAVPPKRRGMLPWIAASSAALLIAAATIWQAGRTPTQEAWSGVMLAGPASAFEPRLSPDGQLLAFLAFADQLPQLAVMKPNGGSWTMRTSDREHGYIATVAWAPDSSKIYFDRMWGHPLGIYSVPPLGGEPRMLLEEAFGPETLPDGSLIVVKLTDVGDNQLFHYWPESGRLDALPAFLAPGDITPMMRAFHDGKELVYVGSSEKERSQDARLLVLDLASLRSHELSPGVRLDPGDEWAPLDVSPDGQSVYVATLEGDTRQLVQVPRKPGRKPRALLSFPSSAWPVGMDAARDGSMYLDLLRTASVILRVPATGGTGEEFAMPATPNYTMVAPDGEMLFTMTGWGKRRLAAVHPGGEPRVLVESSEETALPATIFGDKAAFVIGAGDQRRIAIASLRDGRVLRRFSTRSDTGMAASPDGNTLYYSHSGSIWAQPVAGGDPKRITEGGDVTLDPKGEYLYVKRASKGVIRMIRIPLAGGGEEELAVPADYHVAYPGLSPAAVDMRGRILVPVASNHAFYYQTAILDPTAKSFTLVPMAIDGDAAPAGWAPDGRILARGKRYSSSLWRYQRSKGF
jgi:serine/threonine protein kinase/DNA-binding beta-propeller fold protein YncE